MNWNVSHIFLTNLTCCVWHDTVAKIARASSIRFCFFNFYKMTTVNWLCTHHTLTHSLTRTHIQIHSFIYIYLTWNKLTPSSGTLKIYVLPLALKTITSINVCRVHWICVKCSILNACICTVYNLKALIWDIKWK